MNADRKASADERVKGRAAFLHRSVSEALRQRRAHGHLAQDAKLPSLRKLAHELSVSTMTIRRALRTLEREGHVYRIPGVGSFIRPSPRIAPGRIAFVGSDLTSPFQIAIARGAQRAGRTRGWGVQLLDAHWDSEIESANIRRLPDLGVRGALLLPPFSDPKTPEGLLALQDQGFPVVLVDMTAPPLKADLVSSDHEAGAFLATRHLIDHGYRRILMLTHPPAASSVGARIAGYERALASAGIPGPPEWKVWIDYEVHLSGYRDGRPWWGGQQAILPLLKSTERPLAVLAVDSYTGWGVYEACREWNLRIPEDVSVIAFDDVDVTRALSPPMSVIAQRTGEIAQAAIELLEARIQAGPPAPAGRRELRHVLIDVDLIERKSVTTVR